MKRLTALFLSLSAALPASAEDGYIRAQAMYLSSGSGQGTITKTTRTLVDFGGGWIHSSGFTLGALYATESVTYSSGSPTDNRTSFGPTLGWMQSGDQGPYLLGTYFMTSTFTQYKGTGYQVELGYKIPIQRFSLGIELAYKRFKYNEVSGVQVDPPLEHEYVDPYFVFIISI